MLHKRASGIILHPSSFPGPDGIGDLGPEAYHWVDFLAEAGCGLWQVLPLGPTGYGDSPYQCFSAFAGNPYLVSPLMLIKDGLLSLADLKDRPDFLSDKVDFGPMIEWKLKLLDRAYMKFKKTRQQSLVTAFQDFQKQQSVWLDDYVLFMTIKGSLGGISWDNWPTELRNREQSAIHKFANENLDSIKKQTFMQFVFFRQWKALKDYANHKKIQIIGDIPIFVAFDSADAWSHPELFFINKRGKPTVVAGVPPDYFSPTGQLWGNPLYRWSAHEKTGFSWWISRIKATLQLFDIIRLDHFRGFAGYWEVPAGSDTAEYGRWVPGPGKKLFNAVKKSLGELPIIAEDLGEITPDVIALRDYFQLPGMKILQFAFNSDSEDAFLPHNYVSGCVAYTGTHDNDTSRGWYETASEKERAFCRQYLARSGDDISWDLIRSVWSSVALFVLTPMQDLLSLGTDARMNYPSKAIGNWQWRILSDALNEGLLQRIKDMNIIYGRDLNFVSKKTK
jgi:4-alpha-glucanotransferase